jgi:2-polyprenyl-3-methyl-5-hydroxy-6-metoxy-1,4-benzoquinol methylase
VPQRHPFPQHTAQSPCPACASKTGFRLTAIDNFFYPQTTHLCGVCGLAYTDPLPSPESFAAYHKQDYRKQYKGKPDAEFRLKRIQSVNKKRYHLIKHTLPLPPRGNYLDIGCGYGYLVEAFAEQGWSARGFDPDEQAVHHAQRRIQKIASPPPIEAGTLNSTSHQPDTYDLITAFHVLEHLPNPHTALFACHRWLKLGGHIVIEVPNLITYDHSFHSRFHRAHVVHFSPETLLAAMKVAGFEKIQCHTAELSSAIRLTAIKPIKSLDPSPHSSGFHAPSTVETILKHLTHIRKTKRFTSRSLTQWLQNIKDSISNRLSS